MYPSHPVITRDRFDAVLFDLDGVLTETASVHAAAWKKMFDAFLQQRAGAANTPFQPFDLNLDYQRYVDGKPRYAGVRSFLESRGIDLPYGDPDEPPNHASICGLAHGKNILFNDVLATEGVKAYDGSIAWVRQVQGLGIKTAVVSSSQNCQAVLQAAGIATLFEVRVDGEVAARLHLAGKPAPDTFLKAAAQLGVAPKRAVVVEDALVGVQAGRAGGFGLVIGVNRQADAEALRQQGADLVVNDLGELL